MATRVEAECSFTQDGDKVCLLGSRPELGDWEATKVLELKTGPKLWPRWTAQLPPGMAGAEFKLVIRRRDGSVEWEPVPHNRSWPDAPTGSKLCFRYGDQDMQVAKDSGYSRVKFDMGEDSKAPPVPKGHRAKTHLDIRQRLVSNSDKFRKNIEERFELDTTLLGEGGFGRVVKARDKETGAWRAVKTILKSRVTHMDEVKQELQLTQRMDHPNIVRLYAVYEDHCSLYLVLELCEGGELFDRLVDEKFLTEPVARKIMKQVFSSIAYCHARDVVHRDLKPENYVLMSKARAVDQTPLKLIDFGLATSCRQDQSLSTAVGTPFYVAPEMLGHQYGREVDIWSCGVIMYCLHCGRLPFTAPTDLEVLRQVKRGRYTLDGPIWDQVSAPAKDLIGRCLEMDASKRMTATGALEHSWFQKSGAAADPKVFDPEVLQNLKAFSAANRFQKAALVAVAYNLTAEEGHELRETFTKMDKNGDGYLSFQEVQEGLGPLLERSGTNLSEVFKGMANAEGKLEYTQFIAAAMDEQLQGNEELCWRAFKVFDKDDSGAITMSELQQVIESDELSKMIEGQSLAKIFESTDKDSNGLISFSEFMDMLHSTAVLEPQSPTRSSIYARAMPSQGLGALISTELSQSPQN
ncbi:CPK3 [Symbiodinium necroappetens]|uniref:non-specific serine/threonine protein kinase n=1 Tax=Symbiodinium necroappetens TaxID=1628268 RepID=A0A812TRI0_9DINO|nr:CPK3 [Symbiodinium necroappetens]